MIDVVFFVLVFFMMASLAMTVHQGLPVNLPRRPLGSALVAARGPRGAAHELTGGQHARHRGARLLPRPRRLVPVPAPRDRQHALGLSDSAELEPSARSLDDHGERQHGAQTQRDHHQATLGKDVEGGVHRVLLRANAAAAQILCMNLLLAVEDRDRSLGERRPRRD
jgi:hypothetical protein